MKIDIISYILFILINFRLDIKINTSNKYNAYKTIGLFDIYIGGNFTLTVYYSTKILAKVIFPRTQ